MTMAVVAVALAAAVGPPARAFDLSALLRPDLAADDWIGSADIFAGADATGSSLFSYGGFTLAPGTSLDGDGLRLRVYGGAGRYSYTGREEVRPRVIVDKHRRVDVTQAEALIGWQFSAGALTAKLFGGIAYEDHAVVPGDPSNAIAGAHVGAKAALETWFDLTRWAWLSADASYATTTDAYSGGAKLGLRPFDWLSFGPAAAVFGNQEVAGHSLGAFARWHCGGCDLTVSGGISGDYDDETGAFGALSFYRRF